VLKLHEEEKNIVHNVKLHKVTSSIEEVISNANVVLITHPSFMFEKTIEEIIKYVKPNTIVGAIPGFGGKEFYIKELINKGGIFFGSQRVPSITRLISYGESVALKQKNPFMKLGVVPSSCKERVCEVMTSLIDITCLPVDNYLSITLSPSNPTMHPSRLYELFNDYKDGVIYDRNPKFYEEWGNVASSTLLDLDDELTLILNELNYKNDFNTDDFEKIKKRYSITEPIELNEKIRSAIGFKGIYSPMVSKGTGVIPDLSSRYFIEDLEYGLCILKAFGEILNIKLQTIDKVTTWAQELLGKEYIVDGELIGKDVKNLVIPQNMGIKTRDELIQYYKNL
ncbi:MAG: NAD/NADP octopine/nopaline dehydrogenase family protein, partial [Clostridium sp.]